MQKGEKGKMKEKKKKEEKSEVKCLFILVCIMSCKQLEEKNDGNKYY